MKVIVFDLDDTLYDESTFVMSGFQTVAHFLAKELSVDHKQIFQDMCTILSEQGRGKVFDIVLRDYQLYSKRMVKRCISIYRSHTPNIHLPQESIEVLHRLANHHCYIVTDGNKIVQFNKIKALGLENKVRGYFITHRFGIQRAKPSTYCFEQILKLENEKPENMVYVGDNVNKDFVNIKKLGIRSIRVMTGMYKDLNKSSEYEAEITIQSLSELEHALRLIWKDAINE